MATKLILGGVPLKERSVAPRERRLRSRFPICSPVTILGRAVRSTGVTVDMSASGLCCHVDQPIAAGETVSCVFGLGLPARFSGGSRPLATVKCRAIVIRSVHSQDGCRMALKILSYRLECSEADGSPSIQ
jgi:hypothetical protein